MKLTRRELAAVLAGLRLVQDIPTGGTTTKDPEGIGMVLTDDGGLEPLTHEEINRLCDRVNTAEVVIEDDDDDALAFVDWLANVRPETYADLEAEWRENEGRAAPTAH